MLSTFKENKSVFAVFLALVASSVLGFVAGWFTGKTSGELVVAALLPSVISLEGMAVIWKSETSGEFNESWIPTLSIILFAGFLYYGANVGADQRKSEFLNALKGAKEIWKICTEQELEINALRDELGLEPLSSNVFCPQLSR